jgi:hypothetical protein
VALAAVEPWPGGSVDLACCATALSVEHGVTLPILAFAAAIPRTEQGKTRPRRDRSGLRTGAGLTVRGAVIAATSAMVMLLLDSSIVGVMLPSMRTDLHLGAGAQAWIYLLTLAVLLPVGGRLCDALGAARTFAVGMAGFTVASRERRPVDRGRGDHRLARVRGCAAAWTVARAEDRREWHLMTPANRSGVPFAAIIARRTVHGMRAGSWSTHVLREPDDAPRPER